MKKYCLFLGLVGLVGCNRNPKNFIDAANDVGLLTGDEAQHIIKNLSDKVNKLELVKKELEEKIKQHEAAEDAVKARIRADVYKEYESDVAKEKNRLARSTEDFDIKKNDLDKELAISKQLQEEAKISKARHDKEFTDINKIRMDTIDKLREAEITLQNANKAKQSALTDAQHAQSNKIAAEQELAKQADKANKFVLAVVAERAKFLGNLQNATKEMDKIVEKFEKRTVIDIDDSARKLSTNKLAGEAAIQNIKRFGAAIWSTDNEFVELEKKFDASRQKAIKWLR